MFPIDGNLLEPMTFDVDKIDRFIQRHVCALCGGHLVKGFAEDGLYTANCSNHGPVLATTHLKKSTFERIQNDILAGKIDLKEPERKSPGEIISDLGF